MRLIDADRLKEVFRRNAGHDYSELIDIQPTVDVFDKIRVEIEQITDTMGVRYNQYVSKIDVLQIIDKYRNEVSE
jgi:hypothetical protein